MSYFRPFSIVTVLATASVLSGCGVNPPQIGEVWEGRDIGNNMTLRIKEKIFCELIDALVQVNRELVYNDAPPIPSTYSVQMVTTLTVEQDSGFNPTVTYNNTFQNGRESGISIGQMLNVGVGANLSATATRIDTAYTYFIVGRIMNPNNVKRCHDPQRPVDVHGSSLLLQSELGIHDYLLNEITAARILPSSPGGKDAQKPDVFSYEVKFVVVTNGNINPTWKLVKISGGGGMPFLTGGRTRTHDLILTFGPSKGGLAPSDTARDQLFLQQQGSIINSSVQGR